ncbi:hypothetical protein JCM6882_006995, partial [Rhodosporidiobolus microsporus]
MKDLVVVSYNLRKTALVWDPAIDLRTSAELSVRILNVYNPSLSSSTPNRTVEAVLPPLLRDAPLETPLVVAGDFNLRHGEWDPLLLDAPSDEAEAWRLTLEQNGLSLLCPAGEPTYYGFDGSEPRTLDLMVGNLQAEERLVSAVVDETLKCGSDHRPLRLTLQVNLPPLPPPPPRRLFRKAAAADLLTAYEALAPQRAAQWWTKEVGEASAEARKARNVAVRRRGKEDEEATALQAKM